MTGRGSCDMGMPPPFNRRVQPHIEDPPMANASESRKPKLRDIQKGMTLELIRKAARKIFYSKSFEDVSLDEIAAEAGVSRGTIYLHFPGKNDILLDLLSEDLAAQMAIYEELAAAAKIDKPTIRKWLQHFRDSMDERHPSMRLFPIAFRNMPDRASVVVDHRENAIAKLGARYSGFSLAGIKGIARERKRATIYMMLFKIEQVA